MNKTNTSYVISCRTRLSRSVLLCPSSSSLPKLTGRVAFFRSLLLLVQLIVIVGPASWVLADPFRADPKFCRPYTCGKGLEPVQKWPLSFKSMGCSSLGGIQMFSAKSNKFGSDDPNEVCCDQRNACLQTCGSVKTICDEEFLKCTVEVCDHNEAGTGGSGGSTSESAKCTQSSKVYELMIKMESCQQYDSDQHVHCVCVKQEEAPKRRRDVLRKFYKKFNPEDLAKVDGLAKKADSPRKMATLLSKLVKKYPNAIQRIKDPKQEMMEKLMKQAETKEVPIEESEPIMEEEEEGDIQEL
jgi:hypothetical protein